MQLSEPHVMHTYARYPLNLSHGDGSWVWDGDGRRHLDCLAGIAVNTLGHNHPVFVAALTDQISKLIHTSNLYASPLQEALAAKLCAMSGMEKVFFCSTGLEANEAAIKIARKYGVDQGIELPEIIVFEKAFHGRSLATLSATGNEKVQKGFTPLVQGFVRAPMNNIAAIEALAEIRPNITAVFIEAIQGEGGIVVANAPFLRELRRVCDARGWLLMIDEVQCGMGRTGKWFAHQWADGVVPDVMPLAKGLGGGVPIGAVVARGKAAAVFGPGNHGTTFGGNPLAMRAALTVIEVMEKDNIMHNAHVMGERICEGLRTKLAAQFAAGQVKEIRGAGLMLGVVLDRPCGELVKRGIEVGILFNVTADSIVRLLPPLIFTAAQADELVDKLSAIIQTFLNE